MDEDRRQRDEEERRREDEEQERQRELDQAAVSPDILKEDANQPGNLSEKFRDDVRHEDEQRERQRRDDDDATARREAQAIDLQTQQQWQEHLGAIARDRQDFMQKALAQILADPDHLLRKLVDPQTKDWWARSHLSELPGVQAGHLTSRHSGAPERFALEDPFYNQVSNWKGETQGAIFNKPAVDIGGVPVERRTADEWRRQGLIT